MAHQVWEDTVEGRLHRVETSGDLSRTIVWTIDGERVAEKKTMDGKAELKGDPSTYDGTLQVRFSTLGAPRRATLLDADGLGELGVGGADLTPSPGRPRPSTTNGCSPTRRATPRSPPSVASPRWSSRSSSRRSSRAWR
ncbi:hypothetical protein [Nocardioides currus]|uniref:Uncharacterized protein n=1 Tax=Nocardioides currus TaxID=2133958 RepID=A0A2R7YU40_9ACTN|nr:hypothetical protein [Nocardioides currus]PUA79878.1 hypothetical protein C7S10_17630 [Nocardioides currus]